MSKKMGNSLSTPVRRLQNCEGTSAFLVRCANLRVHLASRILARYSDPKASGTTVVLLEPESGKVKELQLPRPAVGSLSVVETAGKVLLSTTGGSPRIPQQ